MALKPDKQAVNQLMGRFLGEKKENKIRSYLTDEIHIWTYVRKMFAHVSSELKVPTCPMSLYGWRSSLTTSNCCETPVRLLWYKPPSNNLGSPRSLGAFDNHKGLLRFIIVQIRSARYGWNMFKGTVPLSCLTDLMDCWQKLVTKPWCCFVSFS